MIARRSAANALLTARASIWFVLFALALFALSLRIALIWRTGFDGLYGQDPFAYFDYAAGFKEALVNGRWPPPFFWPIGYPALAAMVSTWVPLTLAAETVSVLSGALIAVLTFMIVQEILGRQLEATIGALFAGVIVAGAGRLLISSVTIMSDAAALFWATLSAFAMLRYRQKHALRWIALAALALGWAMTTRWVYGLLIPVWAVALVLEQHDIRSLLGATLVAGAFLLIALIPQGWLMLREDSRETAAFIGQTQDYNTWSLADAFHSDIVNGDGHFTYAWSISTFYSLPLIELDYVPIWFTPLVLFGVWALRKRIPELTLLVGWFGVMWGFLLGVKWENWRFPLAFFPPLAVLTGVGWHWLSRRLPRHRAYFIGAWLGIGLVATMVWGLYDANTFIVRQLDDRRVVSWVDARVPPDATILTFGETATLEHYTSFHVVEMASESPASVEQIAREDRDVFVLLNVDNIESQWQGLAPQINFHALQEHFVLQPVASREAYMLYAVVSER